MQAPRFEGKIVERRIEMDHREKASEAALRKSEERFHGIVESLADWIWEVDASGTFTYSSASSQKLLGYCAEELIGRSVYDFVDPLDVDRVRDAFAEHARNKSPVKSLEHWKLCKDGSRVCMLANGVPILDPDGELIGYRGVNYDVTKQRLLERQALQQQKLESVGLLAGGIAHDFNNILVPIFGYAEMIKIRHASDQKTVGYSSTILKVAEKAKKLVSRLLSFSRQQALKVEPQNLNDIINAFMEIMQRTIRENIEIRLNLSFDPCTVLADRTLIEQVLLNLAVNAQDAISGTGAITIETGHLIFDSECCIRHPGMASGRYVSVTFTDTGSGIDEATLPYVFDPFFTTKPIGHGTGLGLSTISEIVRQHKGCIEVGSKAGVGTTFTLYFPENVGADDPQLDVAVSKELNTPAGTILVVEDNQTVLSMLRVLLENAGHHVITTDEPLQALEIVRSHGEVIDLLVSDMVMPQMNGPELYQRILEQRPGIKVLFISGYAGVVTANNGYQEEKDNFISKPFTMEAFIRKVSEVMTGGAAV